VQLEAQLLMLEERPKSSPRDRSRPISHDITAENTNGMGESLGFNTDTGQHTVSTPGLTGATGPGAGAGQAP